MRTFDEALRGAVRELEAAGVPEAELNAWYLLEEVTGKDKAWFLLHREETLPEAETERLATLVEHRKKRVPLEYLIHRAEFMGLSFYVDDRVLIPRQDTECLVEEALTYAEGSDVLDLCTGSGCIAISLAVLGKPRSMTATDVSTEALAVARQNAEANGAGNKYTAVEFKQGDLWEAVTPAADACAAGSIEPAQFDLITCNPPYIRRAVIPTLMPEVQEYEPILALDGGEDGLDFYRRL
ncbi:MAG: peptide chain release factor N(5)-glutamine methyltransferase, partial [Eubacterium sp.]|nr:peptide chain release factor N(5)-glutamine methyltransferase [Eubacterium sp.]